MNAFYLLFGWHPNNLHESHSTVSTENKEKAYVNMPIMSWFKIASIGTWYPINKTNSAHCPRYSDNL